MAPVPPALSSLHIQLAALIAVVWRWVTREMPSMRVVAPMPKHLLLLATAAPATRGRSAQGEARSCLLPPHCIYPC